MKKIISLNMLLVILSLCGCNAGQNKTSNLNTRIFFDTVVKLDVECNSDVLEGAFALCGKYENLFSISHSESDVSRINSAKGTVSVSEDTRSIIERAVYYGNLSGGKFDITVYGVSKLWDFEGTALPDRGEIAEALKNVDYQQIRISDSGVDSSGKEIELGAIAKGYIADKLHVYFLQNGVENGIINLGGNIYVFGKEKTVGIAKPFDETVTSATVSVKNKSVVTSGIYQRYIKKDGVIYHHILDPNTGYSAETDLLSATVIGESSMDCDAMATVCMLLGSESKRLVTDCGMQAIFIRCDGTLDYTDGLLREKDAFFLIDE